jgi:AraC family transcriptional regulator
VALFKPAAAEHRDRFGSEGGRAVILELPPAFVERLSHHAPCLTSTVVGSRIAWGCGIELYRAARAGQQGIEMRLEELLLTLGSNPVTRTEHATGWLSDVAEMLGDSARPSPSLCELGEAVGRHPIYLARAFRRVYGMSPGEYLHLCRLESAVTALAFGSQPLSALAQQLGYADQSHFGRMFLRAVGSPPARFRRWLRFLLRERAAAPSGELNQARRRMA